MTSSPLIERLAERCEQATGPSYTLDCCIWDAIYPGERDARFEKLTSDGPYKGRLGPADRDGYIKPLRAFTASLDAAMTLVPDGCLEWHCGRNIKTGKGQAYLLDPATMRGPVYVHAETPALALCAAALRAKAAPTQRKV